LLAIFDMDGTLTQSSTLLANSINYVRGKLGLEPLDKDYIIEQINHPDSNMPMVFYNLEEIEPIHEEWFSQYYSRNHTLEQEAFCGVEEMLKRLKSLGIKLAIATNAYRASALETLTHLGIIDYFDEIIGFDDVEEGKPSPQMLLELLDRFDLPNSRAIFIGDSQRDELAAKSAGVEFIKVAFSGNSESDLRDIDTIGRKIEEYFCII